MNKQMVFLLVLLNGCTSAEPAIVGAEVGVDAALSDVSATDIGTDLRAEPSTDSRTDAISASDSAADERTSGDVAPDNASDSTVFDTLPDTAGDATAKDALTDGADVKDGSADVAVGDIGIEDSAGCVVVPNPSNACNDDFRAKYSGVTVCCSMRTEDYFCDSSLAGCRTGKTILAFCEKASGTVKYAEGTCVIPF